MLTDESPTETEADLLAGGIPVSNLWLLMLYASDLYKHLGDRRVRYEENPDQLADLIAEILCHEVANRLSRNLSLGYTKRSDELTRVRGRIDHLRTEAHQLLKKGRIHCHFEELSLDTRRNRYVAAALRKISSLVQRDVLKTKSLSLVMQLERLGVHCIRPSGYSGSTDRFGRHDQADQKMVAAADLAFQLTLPTQQSGRGLLRLPGSDVRWLRRLFERAVGGFYSVTLASTKWKVSPGQRLKWQIDEQSMGIPTILPSMQTDIVLDYPPAGYRLVIDTKFNEITKPGHYRNETLRSGYLYQIYAYLRSQEREGD
jgi:5-methylcytosine-specific restriction enzyme subunit McrC